MGAVREGVGRAREKVEQELEKIDATVVWMPEGMEKRAKNSTRWDARDKYLHLTIECRFRSREAGIKPVTVLSHDISIQNTLSALFDRLKQQKKTPLPPWAVDALSSPDSLFLLPSYPPRGHFLLDKTKPLEELLKGKTWVEWPIIEVWEKATFKGQIWQGGVRRAAEGGEGAPPAKKRKVEADGEVLKGLVGGYDSDEEEDEKEDGELQVSFAAKRPLVLYPDDDDDAELIDIVTQRDDDQEGEEGEEGEEEEEEEDGAEVEISPEELERMRQELAQSIAEAAKQDDLEDDDDDDDTATLQHLDQLVQKTHGV
ncbi:hypothetical protein CALCODRAFT_511512 [Calocera cornea HHB12733]|uniref:BCD1 alpha/beta domain-containing protein n=1 Tax=Calocera cornea HHB12733 TaxID=1353952 RepID=A0A165DQG9_9BASI|nr:hypothetical protein CALCODRAFT_511512 [Calocera cornea HHB12733]